MKLKTNITISTTCDRKRLLKSRFCNRRALRALKAKSQGVN